MPDEQQLADYLDDALTAAERAAIEAQFGDDEVLRTVAEQRQIDAALRVLFSDAENHLRVKRAILSEVHAEPFAAAKARLLRETVAPHSPRKRSGTWIASGGALAAAACVLLALRWQSVQPPRIEPLASATPAPLPRVVAVTPAPATPPSLVARAATPTPTTPAFTLPERLPAATPAMIVAQATPVRPDTPPALAVIPRSTPKPLAAATPPMILAKLETRSAGQWPFAAESPWNQPLGSGAHFEHLRPATRDRANDGNIGIRWRTIAAEDRRAPAQRLVTAGGSETELNFTVPAESGRDPDQPWCVIDREERFATEFAGVQRNGAGVITASTLRRVDLRGAGFGPGVAEFGGPALGGVLRHGEAAAGIRHALCIALNRHALNHHTPGGKPFVWPASAAPPNARRDFANLGNVHLGSLLAIPPKVNLETLGVGARGSLGHALAQAMQDYGVYVTGSCEWQSFHFFTAEADAPPNFDAILTRLFRELQVVTNNTAATPGGGGTPRRARAPDFSETTR